MMEIPNIRIQRRFVILGCCLAFALLVFLAVLACSLCGPDDIDATPLKRPEVTRKSLHAESTPDSPCQFPTPGDATPSSPGNDSGDMSSLASQVEDIYATESEDAIKPTIPVFYRIKPETFSHLAPEQQFAVLALQRRYLEYYQKKGGDDLSSASDWNDAMREFHQDLVNRLGSETADQLLR